jgi:hypothetical protein
VNRRRLRTTELVQSLELPLLGSNQDSPDSEGRGEPPNASNLHAFMRVCVTDARVGWISCRTLLCFTHSDVTVGCLLSATSNPKADLHMGKQCRVDEASLDVNG